MSTLKSRKVILFCGFILILLATAFARPNPICRNKNGNFPRLGTSCRGYYECKNYVPEEKTCPVGENFNANKGRCDREDLYPCLEKEKDKECLKENGLFLKPGTDCKRYYRCCNGKAKVETCSGDLLFDPSKGNCEWPDLFTCVERLSTTEKVSTIFSTPKPTPKTSTDPETSKITAQKTTASKILTSRSTTDISTTLKPKEISTSEIPTSQPTAEISSLLPKTTKISTSQSTITEISISQPSTTEMLTSQLSTEISTLQSIKIETSTSQLTTGISTSEPTTQIPTSQTTITQISTSGPTTEISTSLSTITEVSTLQSTTATSTSQPAIKSSTLQPTTIEISRISQTTSPEVSSTLSTDHTVLKENKEGELTPTVFETTKEVTFSPSTAEATTFTEVNIMCPEPNGYFPHPTDKHKFVGCVNNIPHVLTCPSDLVYRHHLRRCDHE